MITRPPLMAITGLLALLATSMISAQVSSSADDLEHDTRWDVAGGITACTMRSSHVIGASSNTLFVFGNSGYALGGLVEFSRSRSLAFDASLSLVSRPHASFSLIEGAPPVAGGGGPDPSFFEDDILVNMKSVELAVMAAWKPLHVGSALSIGITGGMALGWIHTGEMSRYLSVPDNQRWRFYSTEGYLVRSDGYTAVLAEDDPIHGLNRFRYGIRAGAVAGLSVRPWLRFTPRIIYEIGLNSITDQNAGLSREVPTLTEGGWTVNSWFFGMDVGVRLGEL